MASPGCPCPHVPSPHLAQPFETQVEPYSPLMIAVPLGLPVLALPAYKYLPSPTVLPSHPAEPLHGPKALLKEAPVCRTVLETAIRIR